MTDGASLDVLCYIVYAVAQVLRIKDIRAALDDVVNEFHDVSIAMKINMCAGVAAWIH